MSSKMNFFAFILSILAAGCNSGTSNPIPRGFPLVQDSASDPNVKSHVLDNAVVAGEMRTVTMTESGDGSSGNPIGIDIDWGRSKE